MSEVRNINFEKFLKRLKKTISKLLDHYLLMPVLLEVSDKKIRIFVYDGMDHLITKRIYCNDYTTLLISHFVTKGITEPNEYEVPYTVNYKPGSCYYLIGKEELNKI